MKTRKEKAIDLILLGMAIQFIPVSIIGAFSVELDKLPPIWSLLISLSVLGTFLGGYIFFIKGCRLYAQSKGYTSVWGLLGLVTFFGLSILVLLPSRTNSISLPPDDESVPNEIFYRLNIPELFLYLISSNVVLFIIRGFFSLLNKFDFEEFINNNINVSFLSLISWLIFAFYLFKIFQKSGLLLHLVVGKKNKIILKIIWVLLVIKFAFSKGIYGITLYGLSFTFPAYVAYFLNENRWHTIPEILFDGGSAMLLAPLIEEFFFRGIILQKFALKWGIKKGIVVSSFIFAVYHFRHDIISLFAAGLLYSILYFKTRSLLAPILLHFLNNTLITILNIIDYYNQSPIERSQFISVQDYQDWMQPLLGQHILLIALSLPVLIYFISKNFPRNDAIIPYYANEENQI